MLHCGMYWFLTKGRGIVKVFSGRWETQCIVVSSQAQKFRVFCRISYLAIITIHSSIVLVVTSFSGSPHQAIKAAFFAMGQESETQYLEIFLRWQSARYPREAKVSFACFRGPSAPHSSKTWIAWERQSKAWFFLLVALCRSPRPK